MAKNFILVTCEIFLLIITNFHHRFFIFTHLNDIGGRYVFPCLDQINMKATFKMTLIYPKGLKGFTNAKSETTGDE